MRAAGEWDPRPMRLMITWADTPDGVATPYQRVVEDLPRIIEELLTAHSRQWVAFTVETRTPER